MWTPFRVVLIIRFAVCRCEDATVRGQSFFHANMTMAMLGHYKLKVCLDEAFDSLLIQLWKAMRWWSLSRECWRQRCCDCSVRLSDGWIVTRLLLITAPASHERHLPACQLRNIDRLLCLLWGTDSPGSCCLCWRILEPVKSSHVLAGVILVLELQLTVFS